MRDPSSDARFDYVVVALTSSFLASALAAHQEGGYHRQVRSSLWLYAPQGREEVRCQPALEVHVRLLRQGQRQARCRRHLVLRRMPQDDGGWRVYPGHCTGGAGSCASTHRGSPASFAALGRSCFAHRSCSGRTRSRSLGSLPNRRRYARRSGACGRALTCRSEQQDHVLTKSSPHHVLSAAPLVYMRQ